MLPTLTLYGRAGCHLCEVAAEHLRALLADAVGDGLLAAVKR